jgi:sugar-specific transcriptional regulator TrmB
MRRRLEYLLRSAGLSTEEVKIYLLLLKHGHASVPALIALSGMNIMTAYRAVKKLLERELIDATKINRKQSYYSPLPLSSLVSHLEEDQRKMRKLQLALQGLDRFLPFLDTDENSTRNQDDPLEVREGLDAFREEYMKIPNLCTDEFLCMGSMQNYWKAAHMSDESPEELAFRHKRYQKNTFARVFNTHAPEAEAFARRDAKEKRTTRLVDEIPIVKDYLAFTDERVCHFICNEEHQRVIVIRHPELVSLHRKQFEQMWKAGVGA